jgi:hypothetical protein
MKITRRTVREIATYLKIRARVCELKQLALENLVKTASPAWPTS